MARAGEGHVRVSSQRRFGSLEHHGTASRPDLLIEVYWPSEGTPTGEETTADVIMVESKIGSKEGHEQLRRYAEHLQNMRGYRSKTLLYITRGYDPKDPLETGPDDGDVGFEQRRWRDFYRFLQGADKDALVDEVMTFMEEQGMGKDYRFSADDLIALSGMPRALDIIGVRLDSGRAGYPGGAPVGRMGERRGSATDRTRGSWRPRPRNMATLLA